MENSTIKGFIEQILKPYKCQEIKELVFKSCNTERAHLKDPFCTMGKNHVSPAKYRCKVDETCGDNVAIAGPSPQVESPKY